MDNMNYGSNGLEKAGKPDGMAIASLVLGIVAIVMSCCITYVGLACGVVGAILAFQSNKKQKTGMATAGMVCSIIGIVLSIVLIIVGVVFGTALTAALANL